MTYFEKTGRNSMPVSLIISAYNQLNALKIVFDSFKISPPPVQEIIFADDGSSDGTHKFIQSIKSTYTIPIHHVYQEDMGFRKALILNKAILKSSGKLLIFIDGDIIPFPNTLKMHISKCKDNCYSVGSKLHLTKEESLNLKTGFDINIFNQKLTKRLKNKLLYQQLKNQIYILFHKRTRPKFFGCNFAADKDLIIRVNGFDNQFDGFGWEDSDLRNRMNNAGAKPVSLWNIAPSLHISHQIDPRRIIGNSEKGRDIKKPQLYTLNKKLIQTGFGLNSLLEAE